VAAIALNLACDRARGQFWRWHKRLLDHPLRAPVQGFPRLSAGSYGGGAGRRRVRLPHHRHRNLAAARQGLALRKLGQATRDLRTLAKDSLEPEKLDSFIRLIESDAIYSLYTAVSHAKTQLSEAPAADLSFHADGVSLSGRISREDFESWIAPDLGRIETCVDEVLRLADLDARGIDKVFLTGGTSFVPAVRRIFDRRFGRERVETGDELLAVASGLALIGDEPNIERWEAPPD
jgi:hypothetical chaperone protein